MSTYTYIYIYHRFFHCEKTSTQRSTQKQPMISPSVEAPGLPGAPTASSTSSSRKAMRRWNPTSGTDDVVQLDDEKYAFNGVWIWNLYEIYIIYIYKTLRTKTRRNLRDWKLPELVWQTLKVRVRYRLSTGSKSIPEVFNRTPRFSYFFPKYLRFLRWPE